MAGKHLAAEKKRQESAMRLRWRRAAPIPGPPAAPCWSIRSGPEIWLVGGCIDSLEDLNEAEELLRCIRPLMQAKEDARTEEKTDAKTE